MEVGSTCSGVRAGSPFAGRPRTRGPSVPTSWSARGAGQVGTSAGAADPGATASTVVEAVADLVAFLVATCRDLRVLTTTRAPLGIAAEHVYLLGELDRADAAALFRERAGAARPDAVLPPAAVAAVVARLDGLPLAIELAAAKVRVMSVAEIERRLGNRFALLRGRAVAMRPGAAPDAARGHGLERGTCWQEDERIAPCGGWPGVPRRVLAWQRRRGRCSGPRRARRRCRAAGRPVAGRGARERGAGVRYRLLETVREFGQMQLVDAGDDVQIARRLRHWGVVFSRRAESTLFGPGQVETMAEIRVEEGNLVDLLRRCLRERDVDGVVELMACLSDFWTVEGSHLKVVGLARDVEDLVLVE